jgi:hypothetical protein
MYTFSNGSATPPTLRNACRRFLLGLSLATVTIVASSVASASEGSASVYPAGVETIMPGRLPGPGGSVFEEFNNFYQSNGLVGSNGRPLLPGFHLRAAAAAVKLIHNWDVRILGGTLVSSAAAPLVYLHVDAPFGKGDNAGIGNPDLETVLAYTRGALHWWYGVEVYTPGFSYQKNALVNIGQHNYATAPAGAFTYMPNHGRTEVSSKFQYIVNYTNDATHYRSGGEFVWEYDGMQNITKRLAVGFNGYFYQQATDDLKNGLAYLGGNRARNLAFGPEIRYHFSHYAMILKYEKDFLTENKPVGNSFWLQIGIPIGSPHHD